MLLDGLSDHLHLLLQTLLNWAFERPVTAFLLLLIIFFIYKVVTFHEIILHFNDEVPKNVRRAGGISFSGSESHLPPPYPNGWIPVLESRALRPGQVKSVLAFGQELAVVRGSTGKVYVLDAFCPHLGANLAVGGTVEQRICSTLSDNNNNEKEKGIKEDCLRCPFHGWSFRMSDGQCAHIPYEDSPVNAKVSKWTSLELNNVIFVWYHSNGTPPTWTPNSVEELSKPNRKWVYRGRTEHHVNCHMQEIPENGADIAHLNAIHVDSILYGSDLNILNRFRELGPLRTLLTHEWSAQWSGPSGGSQSSHMASIDLVNTTKLFGMPIFTVKFDVQQIGPAYVELRFRAEVPFKSTPVTGIFLQFVKPVGPMKNCVVHQVYTESSVLGYIFGKFLILAEARMFERDIRIWNRKAFLRKPYVSKSEKALVKYRRWFAQFYSEGGSLGDSSSTSSLPVKPCSTFDW